MTPSLPADGTNPYGDQLREWLQVARHADGTIRGQTYDLYMSSYDAPSDTDHTQAFIDALDEAADMIAAGHGRVRIILDSRQEYTIGGPLIQGAAGQYAQIPLPFSDTVSGQIELVGLPGGDVHWVGLGQTVGTVIRSTFTDPPAYTYNGATTYGIASIFGGPSSFRKTFRDFGAFSYIWYGFRNITVRSPAPVICGVDAGYLNGLFFDNLCFDTDECADFPGGKLFTSTDLTICTALQAIPLVTPLQKCYYGTRGGSLAINAWSTGLFIGDLVNIDDVLVFAVPGAAVNLDTAPQLSRIGYLRDWNNAYGIATYYPQSGYGTVAPTTTGSASQSTITIAAASPLKIDAWLPQRDNGGSDASLGRVYDLFDSNNVCPVEALMARNSFANGNPREIGGFLLRGGGNSDTGPLRSRIVDMNRMAGPQTAPSVPTSTVPIRNPFFRDALVTVSGGTVSGISVNGVSTGLTSGHVIVPANASVTLTYTVAPTWTWQTT